MFLYRDVIDYPVKKHVRRFWIARKYLWDSYAEAICLYAILVILVLAFVENHAHHAKSAIRISNAASHCVRYQSLKRMKKYTCSLNVVVVS